jgi:hypothetical protein
LLAIKPHHGVCLACVACVARGSSRRRDSGRAGVSWRSASQGGRDRVRHEIVSLVEPRRRAEPGGAQRQCDGRHLACGDEDGDRFLRAVCCSRTGRCRVSRNVRKWAPSSPECGGVSALLPRPIKGLVILVF